MHYCPFERNIEENKCKLLNYFFKNYYHLLTLLYYSYNSYVAFHVKVNEKENTYPLRTILPSRHIINLANETHNERVYHKNKIMGTGR